MEYEEQLFWDEVERDEKTFNFKCKPTYQFQSIEFDFRGTKDDIPEMVEMYNQVLQELMKIAPAQEKGSVQVSNLATDKQKETMKRFGIKFAPTTTREEAQRLIQKSIDNIG